MATKTCILYGYKDTNTINKEKRDEIIKNFMENKYVNRKLNNQAQASDQFLATTKLATKKPTAGCQISTLIFEVFLWRGVSLNIP